MKRVYKEIKDFIFEGSETLLKPGDVVILRLNGGNTMTYIVNGLIPRTNPWDTRCYGCAFDCPDKACPTLTRVTIDIRNGGRRVVAEKRNISKRVLCQASSYEFPRIIFKSVDKIMEGL